MNPTSIPTSEEAPRSWRDHWVPSAIFAVLGFAILVLFLHRAAGPERVPRPASALAYDPQRLEAALASDGFARRLEAIAQAGDRHAVEEPVGRFTGSPGCARTAALVEACFRDAGLSVVAQPFRVAVPRTQRCVITDPDGMPLPGVRLSPYGPAGILPVATPPDGLRARLVGVPDCDLRSLDGHDPSKTLVVGSVDAITDWSAFANVGVQGVMVREDPLSRALLADADQALPWGQVGSAEEHTFPRWMVEGPIEDYLGREVVVHSETAWSDATAHNVVGVLRAAKPRDEALVVACFYDSNSAIPDVAPGAEQSLSLALMLELVAAIAPYRDSLTRDLIFVATAGHAQSMSGVSSLMEALDPAGATQAASRSLEPRRLQAAGKLAWAEAALDAFEAGSRQGLCPKLATGPARDWFVEAWRTAAGNVCLARRELSLQARLAYLRAGAPVYRDGFDPDQATPSERADASNTHPLLAAYLGRKRDEERASALTGLSPEALAEVTEFDRWEYAAEAKSHFRALAEHHRRELQELDGAIAVRDLFKPYARTLTLNLELYSDGGRVPAPLALLVGTPRIGTSVEPQVSELARVLNAKAVGDDGRPLVTVQHWGPRDAAGSPSLPNPVSPSEVELESQLWHMAGRMAFTLSNLRTFPPRVLTPEDRFDRLPATGTPAFARPVARWILAVAHGEVPFKTLPVDRSRSVLDLTGRVVCHTGGGTMVPNHRLGRGTVVRVDGDRLSTRALETTRGVALAPVLPVDPYGEFRQPFAGTLARGRNVPLDFHAFTFDATGQLRFCVDRAPAVQTITRSTSISSDSLLATDSGAARQVAIPMFRATPVLLTQSGNPQTMKRFVRAAFLDRAGLSDPPHVLNGTLTTFVEPDLAFYVGMLDGAADNPQIQQYRAFLLNPPAGDPEPGEPDIHGSGYLAADHPSLPWVHIAAAESMLRTAGKRLRLQQRYGMADRQMLEFHEQGLSRLEEARALRADGSVSGAVQASGSSLAYAINNHPVIRGRISQAVTGILWYLGLLVPFVFFFEKLVFGFADIRKQLCACALIFLAFFGMLRWLHPAFQLVRSSLVILLGFLIFFLTLLVTLMVGGKFRQNLRDLRRGEGRVEGADVHRGGVVGTAFMLGLNNMRRRKVRTGLTSLALVLITFVIICFTSVSSNLVNEEFAVGRSPWNGLLIRNTTLRPLERSEVADLQQVYGSRYPVAVRRWLVGLTQLVKAVPGVQNTELPLDFEEETGGVPVTRRARAAAAVLWDWDEPQFSGMDRFLVTRRGWFEQPPRTRAEKIEAARAERRVVRAAILPDTLARELGIRPEEVDANDLSILIRGETYRIQGIVQADKLDALRDPDGFGLLPYDLNNVQGLGVSEGRYIVPADTPRLSASHVVIVNQLPPVKSGYDEEVIPSCGVLFPKKEYTLRAGDAPLAAVGYRTQRAEVQEYLERTGRQAYYAADGIGYLGSRRRTRSLAGLMELLVPILLAAMTVFNTMRSSVYERKSEIYVYNAVGIAPNHVFFIFMAEALVYAVVGAMLGYLLSQGTGRLLMALGWTGGLNMDYSSIETVYASVAIMAAVLLSTVLPARDAARLASPSEAPAPVVPQPGSDTLEFLLPFTFTAHDRLAVIAYFHRWLDANGPGSSGPFFCAPSELDLVREHGACIPAISSTVWLKPYDLGVSQRVRIDLPTDPATGEFVARLRIERLSGQVSAWHRTMASFLRTVRKQFLNWRVTTLEDRQELFAESKTLLERELP